MNNANQMRSPKLLIKLKEWCIFFKLIVTIQWFITLPRVRLKINKYAINSEYWFKQV